ncbi:hypothetical protein Trydic_g10338 [Trypoxylus dichotomus]
MEHQSREFIQQSPIIVKEEPCSDTEDIFKIDFSIEDSAGNGNIKQEFEDVPRPDSSNVLNNGDSSTVILKIARAKQSRRQPRKIKRKISSKKFKSNCEQETKDIIHANGVNARNEETSRKLVKMTPLENFEDVIGCEEPIGLSTNEKMYLKDNHDTLLEVSKITEFKQGRGRPKVLMKNDSFKISNVGEDRNVVNRQVTKSSAIYYECKICLKPYKTFEDLRSHNRLHKDKNLQCKECNRLYLRWDHLYKHQKSQHNFTENEMNWKRNGIVNKLDTKKCIKVLRRKRKRRALRTWSGAYKVRPKEVKNFAKVRSDTFENNAKKNMCCPLAKYDVDGSIIGVECGVCFMYFPCLEDWRNHRRKCSLGSLDHALLESKEEPSLYDDASKPKIRNICNSSYFLRKKFSKKKDGSEKTMVSSFYNRKEKKRRKVKQSADQLEIKNNNSEPDLLRKEEKA